MMIGSGVNNRRKQNGYTLIELLLVVTVIALIAALGVKTYRDKAASDRINIAALNIQHVLEAGMSYNVAHKGYWPQINWNSSGCASGGAVSDQDFVKNYLPNESNQSNFGSPLCWSGDDPNDATLPQQGKRFWVAMNTGVANGSNSIAVTTAQRIAARLPNAIITSNPNDETSSAPSNLCNAGQPCYVKAVVTVPSTSSESNGMYIAATGNCDPNIHNGTPQIGSGTGASCERTTLAAQFPDKTSDNTSDSLSQYTVSFQCKPGEIPQLYATPNFLRMDRYDLGAGKSGQIVEPLYNASGMQVADPHYANPPDFQDYNAMCKDSTPTPTSGLVTCTLNVQAGYNAQNGLEIDTVGCTDEMVKAGICSCPKDASSCPNVTGAIGASYVAVCNPPGSASRTAQKDGVNNW